MTVRIFNRLKPVKVGSCGTQWWTVPAFAKYFEDGDASGWHWNCDCGCKSTLFLKGAKK